MKEIMRQAKGITLIALEVTIKSIDKNWKLII